MLAYIKKHIHIGKRTVILLELSLAAALIISIVAGACLHEAQQTLSQKLIRLHVLANSDSASDQSIKLSVRDQVLKTAQTLLDGEDDINAVYTALESGLDEINDAARQELAGWGSGSAVRTELTEDYFETRVYDGFKLPAGRYKTLRVVIGQGKGKNWWCVVFPPLCMSAAQNFDETAQAANLTPEEVRLITEDGGGYQLKFQLVEWVEGLMH